MSAKAPSLIIPLFSTLKTLAGSEVIFLRASSIERNFFSLTISKNLGKVPKFLG